MSATIIPFPSRVVAQAASLAYCCDIVPAKRRGFAHVDACVPMDLTVEFVNMVNSHCGEDSGAFCDIMQPEPRGMALIDACVPETLAEEFRAIVAAASYPTAA
jgi:hypothetical protein